MPAPAHSSRPSWSSSRVFQPSTAAPVATVPCPAPGTALPAGSFGTILAFATNLLFPSLSKHPEDPKGHLGLSPAPSSSLLPLALPSPRSRRISVFCHFRGPKSQEGASQSFGLRDSLAGAGEGTGNRAVTNPSAHLSPWEQAQLPSAILGSSGLATRRSGARTRFVGRQNLGRPRCLLSASIMKMLNRRVT